MAGSSLVSQSTAKPVGVAGSKSTLGDTVSTAARMASARSRDSHSEEPGPPPPPPPLSWLDGNGVSWLGTAVGDGSRVVGTAEPSGTSMGGVTGGGSGATGVSVVPPVSTGGGNGSTGVRTVGDGGVGWGTVGVVALGEGGGGGAGFGATTGRLLGIAMGMEKERL
jgi:hypothetical protein